LYAFLTDSKRDSVIFAKIKLNKLVWAQVYPEFVFLVLAQGSRENDVKFDIQVAFGVWFIEIFDFVHGFVQDWHAFSLH